jgi:hypothetical protein
MAEEVNKISDGSIPSATFEDIFGLEDEQVME